jgi:MOSC domain-containing protein YiiM
VKNEQFPPESPLGRLIHAPINPGQVVWMGIRPQRRAAMQAVADVLLQEDKGLVGDHYSGRSGIRQVTLIEREQLLAVASYMRLAEVEPASVRRNIVTAGINLHALKSRHFRMGEAVLELTGECHPCSRMEENLGVGGYNAMRGTGGMTARVISAGRVRLGDPVAPVD